MVMLAMDFYIPPFERKLFLGPDGKTDIAKVEASYEKSALEELRNYPGLIWKVWAIEDNCRHGSGYYLFADEHAAAVRKKFAEKFYLRKGMFFVRCTIRTVLENCSEYTRAPVNAPANPPMTADEEKSIMHPRLEPPLKMLKHKKALIEKYEKGKETI